MNPIRLLVYFISWIYRKYQWRELPEDKIQVTKERMKYDGF